LGFIIVAVGTQWSALASSLSGFPRECAGSPFGDHFQLSLGLILNAADVLSSLC